MAGAQKAPSVAKAHEASPRRAAAWSPGSGQQHRHHHRAGEPGADGRQAPAPVRHPAGQRAHDGLDRRGDQEDRADRDAAGAEVVEAQRRQHLDHPGEQGGQGEQPEAGQHVAAAQRAQQRRHARARRGRHARRAPGPDDRPRPPADTPLNTTSGPTTVAAPPSTGPSSTPTMAAARAEPISSPRRSAGAADTSHVIPAAHMQAPPMPWTKRASVEQDDVPGEREGQAGDPEQRQSGEQRGLDAPACGQPAARERAGEGAGRIGGGEHAGRRLRQVELVRVVGQQRRDGGEEHGVHQHHRSHEKKQPPHARRCYASAVILARRCPPCVKSSKTGCAYRRCRPAAATPRPSSEACGWACERIEAAGGRAEQVTIDGGHPMAVGELRCSRAGAPTVLAYGHYDVQAAGPRGGAGTARPSSRPSATGACTRAAPPTTRATSCPSCTWPASWRAPASCP